MTTTTDPHETVTAVAGYLRALMVATGIRRDSCILGTRLAREVLAYFGLPATAVPVRFAVFNPAAWALLEANDGALPDPLPDGAWSVGVAASGVHGPGRWDGHLVLRVDVAEPLLLDVTIDQASRPERGIVLDEPVVAPWPDRLAADGGPFVFVDGADNRLAYEVIEDTLWRRSPDWTRGGADLRRLTGLAIRAVRGAETGSRVR